MIKISNRLKSLVKYVYREDKIMDVGCDHAILDIYLVQSGQISKIYVGDVNPNALENGKKNIERYELSNNIYPILSYGIEKIGELDVDTLIISGMGSKNIIDILSSPNLDRVYKLILQSNNNHFELREFLANNNFRIMDEEVVPDGKKTYVNIVAIRSIDKPGYTRRELEFGPVLSTEYSNLNYFIDLKKTYENIYYASRSQEAKEKLQNLEEIIESLSK